MSMLEFMLLILNQADSKSSFSAATELEFLNSCKAYIAKLEDAGLLIAAQPLLREGLVVKGNKGNWIEASLNLKEQIQVGYYHIRATDLEQALSIAKENPEFAFTQTAAIEVRPVKMKEIKTEFVYPK